MGRDVRAGARSVRRGCSKGFAGAQHRGTGRGTSGRRIAGSRKVQRPGPGFGRNDDLTGGIADITFGRNRLLKERTRCVHDQTPPRNALYSGVLHHPCPPEPPEIVKIFLDLDRQIALIN